VLRGDATPVRASRELLDSLTISTGENETVE
jgi:hypothetical protein